MTSWGTGPWGLGAYGVAAALTVERAWAVSTHEAVVVLSRPPLDRSLVLPGDVRNPLSWQFSVPATLQVFEVAEITPHEHPLSWRVRSVQQFINSTGTMRVTAVTLRDAADHVVTTPDSADFAGVTEVATSTPQALLTRRRVGSRDLASAPSPSSGDTNLGGVLVVQGGDYALVEGPALIQKLLLRRLTTTPGDFYHIPAYGVGLRVKQPIPGGDLVRFKAAIERELMLEQPGISSVSASISQRQNTLSVKVTAVMTRTGEQVTVALNSPIGQTLG